jgi:hypothetical protein
MKNVRGAISYLCHTRAGGYLLSHLFIYSRGDSGTPAGMTVDHLLTLFQYVLIPEHLFQT